MFDVPKDFRELANSLTYYSVADENLSLYQIGYTTGASITTSNVTVKNGDASYYLCVQKDYLPITKGEAF